jgi:hypothetical protein
MLCLNGDSLPRSDGSASLVAALTLTMAITRVQQLSQRTRVTPMAIGLFRSITFGTTMEHASSLTDTDWQTTSFDLNGCGPFS